MKHYKRANKVCTLHLWILPSPNVLFQFYEGIAVRASNNGHAIDLFGGCLNQVGLLEMRSLPNSTNGVVVLSDSFTTAIFKQRFLRVFNEDAGSKGSFINISQFRVANVGLCWAAVSGRSSHTLRFPPSHVTPFLFTAELSKHFRVNLYKRKVPEYLTPRL